MHFPLSKGRLASSAAGSLEQTVRMLVLASASFILLTASIRYLSAGRKDPSRCHALLNRGRWSAANADSAPLPFQSWEPSGCRMHQYSARDIAACLGSRKLLFVGDVVTRQIFWATARRLHRIKAEAAMAALYVSRHTQHALSFDDQGVKLRFIWDPWLNSSALHDELRSFTYSPSPPFGIPSRDLDEQPAALVILGAPGHWAARHGGPDYYRLFQESVDDVQGYLRHSIQDTAVVPEASGPLVYEKLSGQIFLTPVQAPHYKMLSAGRLRTMTPDKIDRMNGYLKQRAGPRTLWSYSELTDEFEETGLHATMRVAERKADIALNARCNPGRAAQGELGETTCCVAYPPPQGVQTIILLAGLVLLPIATHLAIRLDLRSLSVHLPSVDSLRGLHTLVLLAAYCFLADRTTAFDKAERHPAPVNFIVVLCVFFVMSIVTWRRQSAPAMRQQRWPAAADQSFLGREQTRELRGWMQVAFLLLSFHGYSEKYIGVYKTIRLFGSCYAFLSTYGHTRYLIGTADYSFERIATILVRTNTLPCLTSLTVGTNWTQYYFAGLVSFWFLVTYLTLRIVRGANNHLLRLFLKLSLSAFFITLLAASPRVLDLAGRVITACCSVSWNTDEVALYMASEIYVAYAGMLVAILVHRGYVVKAGQTVDLRDSGESRVVNHLDKLLYEIQQPTRSADMAKFFGLAWAVALFVTFVLLTQLLIVLKDVQVYDEWHPYVAWVPIVAYVVIRNCHRKLREVYLPLMAYVGDNTLELYVLHQHIWLSGNGTGRLRTGLWDPGAGNLSQVASAIEVIAMTTLLLFLARKGHDATQRTTAWWIGSDMRQGTLGMDVEADAGGSRLRSVGGGKARHGAGVNRLADMPHRSDLAGSRAAMRDARVRVAVLLAALWTVTAVQGS